MTKNKLKQQYPQAKLIAHPECEREVLELADFVGSTAAMLKHVAASDNKEFVVVTENGILHEMKKQNPDKIFYSADNQGACVCRSMKMNNLENIYQALKEETPELIMDEDTIEKAKKPILRMLELS